MFVHTSTFLNIHGRYLEMKKAEILIKIWFNIPTIQKFAHFKYNTMYQFLI